MKISKPSIPLFKVLQAFAFTIAIAGVVHLIAAAITAIIKHKISYINPVEFLGLSILFPHYSDSRLATLIAWLVLVIIFLCILGIEINKHLYISIIHERKKNISAILKRSSRKKDL